MLLSNGQKESAVHFFETLQDRLIQTFAQIDGNSFFEKTPWEKPDGGGGLTAVLRGPVIEKAGVNTSRVTGDRYPALEGEHSGKPYFASGVSTIAHLYNPYAPIGHMNLRLLEVGETFWFGGGADLTPCFPFQEDTDYFHQALRQACDLHSCHGVVSYDPFTKWCDEYFFIPHRKSVRGVGGIFFDYLKGPFDELFEFVKAVGNAYAEAYPAILLKRVKASFTEAERERLLFWRGRYAEYNLVYDRGTKFGLMTGGNPDSIFVSLPPIVKW